MIICYHEKHVTTRKIFQWVGSDIIRAERSEQEVDSAANQFRESANSIQDASI